MAATATASPKISAQAEKLLLELAEIFRTSSAILVADHFQVYPAGVEFTLSLWLPPGHEELYECPWEPYQRRRSRSGPLSDDLLRFGILYSDGSKWTNIAWSFPDQNAVPMGPVLVGRGGGGGGNSWSMSYWLWPLPPEGPLTFVAEWPALGIEETAATVNGSAIRQAADEAEVIWPN